MVEVNIDSIRVSLMSEHRIVILRAVDSNQRLPIWIGQFEADAITIQMRNLELTRPMTHDLLKNVITEMGGRVTRVVVCDLRDDTFHARVVVDLGGRILEIDARTSDALALAVRADVPIFVEDRVMDEAGIVPAPDLGEGSEDGDGELSAFREFVDKLDLDDLPLH